MPWVSTTLALLAAAGTALGAWGTYQSNQNKGRIDDLTAQIQATQTFAAGIHEARDFITTDKQVKAMVEFSRLYTLARTPQQKLVLIQMAQISKQWQGLDAMAILMKNDDQLQSPSSAADRKILASMGGILAAAAQQTKTTLPLKGQGSSKRTAPGNNSAAESGDTPLTQSDNAAVAASAALIAALPKPVKQHGWIFLGDVAGADKSAQNSTTPIIANTGPTSARTIPAVATTITACKEVNLQDVPNGKLISIVLPGTQMKTLQPDDAGVGAIATRSVHSPG
ncbi:MAG TPA: hypothetical protein VGD01_08880 [Candidatus Elarobacter sp.]|jgi:hypothetical protein